jgi:hypothetical protein
MYDAETRKDTRTGHCGYGVTPDQGSLSETVQERHSGIAINRGSSDDNTTSVLTSKLRLPDGRIGTEVLKTEFLRSRAEKGYARTTFTTRVSLYSTNHVC